MFSSTFILFSALMLMVFGCVFWDRRKKRAAAGPLSMTVIVPCYNDAATVAETLRSIFAACPAERVEVIAVNDRSTDGSLDAMREVAREWPVRIIDNPVNLGKAASLNLAVATATHPRVLCLDADTLLSREVVADLLARVMHDPSVGAVSCPYSPIERGFLPVMQAMEYSMLRLGQGAGNVTSGHALWGGCTLVRREAFDSVRGFSLNAITEDVDLAFKLNRQGWRVEQSFVFVRTHVPLTWRAWARQKVRWTAGGFQCLFKYPSVWLRNPLQMLFTLSYSALTVSAISGALADTFWFGIGEYVVGLWALEFPVETIWRLTLASYGPALFAKILASVGFSLFSLAYVLPMINRVQDVVRVGWIIPFSIGYFPFYVLVSLGGFALWFVVLRRMNRGTRAW